METQLWQTQNTLLAIRGAIIYISFHSLHCFFHSLFTMQKQEELHAVCKDYMQIIKGKRTKRQRLPSPLRLTMSTTCSSLGGRSSTENSLGFDLPTTSNESRNEEEDMANCLILLAQGDRNNSTPKPSHNNKGGLYLYECKTCNRCFPSFQALGGHRASHKKYYSKASAEEKQGVLATFVNEVDNNNNHNHDNYYCDTTSTTLTLQLSTALYNNNNSSSNTRMSTINAKCKVHECSICGAEFSSGQALGGHMRRHRNFGSAPTCGAINANRESKKHNKDVLNLDLNLPAPEDDHHRESKLFPFQAKEKVIVFSATSSLVDCHY